MPSVKADKLVKSFDRHLARVVEGDNNLRWRLRQAGWKDFVARERPNTDSALEMAVAALEYIGLDDDGAWRCVPELLVAAFAFLRDCGFDGPRAGVSGLRRCLDRIPVDTSELRSWFFENWFRV